MLLLFKNLVNSLVGKEKAKTKGMYMLKTFLTDKLHDVAS